MFSQVRGDWIQRGMCIVRSTSLSIHVACGVKINAKVIMCHVLFLVMSLYAEVWHDA